MISCCVETAQPRRAKKIWQEGSGEILGRYKKGIGIGQKPEWRYVVRQFYVLKCHRNDDNYRFVCLFDELANDNLKKMKVGIIVRATFVENRPSFKHQLDHGRQDKDDDSVESTSWVTVSENLDADHKDPM